MQVFSRARVPGITARQWEKAGKFFQSEGAKVEPAQLRSATGMDLDDAYALVLGVYLVGYADLWLLVIHTCVDHPANERRYLEGFQPVPWKCAHCESWVTDPSELRYELRAVLRSPIEFVT